MGYAQNVRGLKKKNYKTTITLLYSDAEIILDS